MTGLADIIEERKGGAIRKILSTKERLADPHLSKSESDQLRKVIIEEVNSLARLAENLVTAFDGHVKDGFAMNQLWLEQIADALGVDRGSVDASA